jgi:hypothetical protein
VTAADDYRERLGLSREQIENNALFFESYARTVAIELDEWPYGTGDADGVTEDDRHMLELEVATSWSDAASWWALSDVGRARICLSEAGLGFSRAGHGFGSFLLSAIGSTTDPPESDMGAAREQASMLRAVVLDGASPPSPAMAHPQQHAYLFLALAASGAELAPPSHLATQLSDLAERAPHASGNTPVGALGVPIRTIWACASALLNADPDTFFAHYRSAFETRYPVAMQSAHVNRYLWDHGAAPVDVVDMDIVGIASLGAQRFGVDRVLDATEDLQLDVRLLTRIGVSLITRWGFG